MKSVFEQIVQREQAYDEVYRYLDRYKPIAGMEKKEIPNLNTDIMPNRTIWIFWYQGIANAPLLVKKCIESVKKNISGRFHIILLDKDNIEQYVTLETFIKKKFDQGIITKTHFSDILRMELLYLYGGCWIDATVFCSDVIPDYMVDTDLFFFKWSMLSESVLKCSSWWMAAKKGNRTIYLAREYLHRYWEQEDMLRHYYLLHIILSKVVDEDSSCMAEYNGMIYVCNSDPHVLFSNMEFSYCEEKWKAIKDISRVHKLSYKRRFLRGDIYNFYTAFIDGRLC